MLRTIEISPYIYVQGQIIDRLTNGEIAVAVGDKRLVGRPIAAVVKKKEPTD